MAEKALYTNLEQYNGTIKNTFRSNWGTLLSYLNSKDTAILTKKADQTQY